MQFGKFNSDRDSALHFLCSSDWSNESFGDVEAPTGFVCRISNTAQDVQASNTEFTSVLEEWNQWEFNVDNEEFRKSLVGHFLIQEDSNGLVHVREYATETELLQVWHSLEISYIEWSQDEGEE